MFVLGLVGRTGRGGIACQGVEGDLAGKGDWGQLIQGSVCHTREHKIFNVIPKHWGAMESF